MSNVYEAIRTYLTESMYNMHGYDARVYLAKLIAEYDALAPDWDSAPEWAQWVTIFDNGKLIWWECEPNPFMDDRSEYAWIEKDGRTGMATSEKVDPLPIGIDWRLCKWQRPEVTK